MKTLGEILADPARTDTEQFVDFVQAYCKDKGWPVPDHQRVLTLLGIGVHTAIIHGSDVAAARLYDELVCPQRPTLTGRIQGVLALRPQRLPDERASAFRDMLRRAEDQERPAPTFPGIDFRALEERVLATMPDALRPLSIDGRWDAVPVEPKTKKPNRAARRRADANKRRRP